MKKHLCLCAGLLMLLMISAAWADNFDPPNWRGDPGTSWAQWEFLTNNNQPAPDAGYLPFGDPSILVTPGPQAGWFAQNPPYNPEGPSGDGWWNLSGQIDLIMQNTTNLDAHKEVWIQLTWSPQTPADVPIIQITDPYQTTPEDSTPLLSNLIFDQFPLKVYQSVYHIDLIPNPPWEHITIRGGINVDELVVDTKCFGIPEPATWLLLSTGSLLFFAVYRRRKGT